MIVEEELTETTASRTAAKMLAAILVLFSGALAIAHHHYEKSSWFVSVFFLLPLVQILWSETVMGDAWIRYRWVLMGSVFHCSFWAIYLSFLAWHEIPGSFMVVAFWACLLVYAVTVVGVFALTSYIMRHRDSELVDDMKSHPVLTISSFLVLFLYVTFFLMFALAFHDKGTAGHGLFVKQMTSLGVAAASASAKEGNLVKGFWFREGFASFELSSDSGMEKLSSGQCLKNTAAKDDEWLRNCLNCSNMRELEEKLNEFGPHQRVRITVLGHASDRRTKDDGRYTSNFELSEARMYHVQYQLNKKLNEHFGAKPDDHNLEWLLWPASNESLFLGSEQEMRVGRLNPKLSVEIAVVPLPNHITELQARELTQRGSSLELFDYFYFMVYTVTTTGYGDIIPITPPAKLVTILGNLFELFFVVVFLHVLIPGGRE